MKTLNDKELKAFIINFINRKEKESENKDYIEYSYYELKVKANLSEKQIDEVLCVSRDYLKIRIIVFILLMPNLNIMVKKEKLKQTIIWLRLNINSNLLK